MWYRVFCRSLAEVTPAELVADGGAMDSRFRGDDLGWTAGEVILGPGTPVYVERYLTDTDDLRDELNTWAAYLETLDYSTENIQLMERVIQARQLITVRKPLDQSNEIEVERICLMLCQRLAQASDGIYQIEGDGWYSASGALILKEY
jgi:hypothetical protein